MVGLETADASTDGVTSLDAGEEVSNKSAISDVRSDLEIDEQEDELALLRDPFLPELRRELFIKLFSNYTPFVSSPFFFSFGNLKKNNNKYIDQTGLRG